MRKPNSHQRRQETERKRVIEGFTLISNMVDNQEFLDKFGHYIKIDDSFVCPKSQDVIYEKRANLDVDELISKQKAFLANRLDKKFIPKGDSLYFIAPLSSIIPLPSEYVASRVMAKNKNTVNYIIAITLVNGAEYAGDDGDGDKIYHGLSFAIIGYHSNKKLYKTVYGDIYEECVQYLNDFITAYKLFRHDHTINNVTIRTLPSQVAYYHQNKHGKLSNEETLMTHGNDLMDLWEKRLPENPATFESEFAELCEHLASDKVAQYILRLGEKSITEYCLGKYEDSIIDSDRFAELAMRDILRKELGLSDDELKTYKSLYSAKYPDSAVVQKLSEHLGCKGSHIIQKWYKHSRLVRNDIIHGLQIESTTTETAQNALRYNLQIVDLMAEKSAIDFHWYRLLQDSFSMLFEGKIK